VSMPEHTAFWLAATATVFAFLGTAFRWPIDWIVIPIILMIVSVGCIIYGVVRGARSDDFFDEPRGPAGLA
jgi:hypothetical protein